MKKVATLSNHVSRENMARNKLSNSSNKAVVMIRRLRITHSNSGGLEIVKAIILPRH